MGEPGQPNAAVLKVAFWEAMKRCDGDERVHDMDMPYFNPRDSLIDGRLPDELWEHMDAAIQELRAAAESGS